MHDCKSKSKGFRAFSFTINGFAGSNYTIRNNYVHDAFQEGIALETFDDCETMSNNIVSGNLIERATQGILLCNWDTEVNVNHIFKDILVEDNIVLDSGINNYFSTDWENEYCNAMVLQGGPCAQENLIVRNNIFAVATGVLVQIDEYSEKYSHIFRRKYLCTEFCCIEAYSGQWYWFEL